MSARRTKKVAPPTAHELRVHIDKLAGTPEADALVADLEADGLTNWAVVLRRVFADRKRASLVNAWEERHIDPHGVWLNTLDVAQQYVNQLWAELGYADPPVVTPLTTEETAERRHLVASANENEIRLLGDGAKANLDTVICHEAAHVLAKRIGICDLHGPNWFGVYLSLLERLKRFDMAALKASAAAAALEWAPLPTASESLMAETALTGKAKAGLSKRRQGRSRWITRASERLVIAD
jgi:hypothetical protein